MPALPASANDGRRSPPKSSWLRSSRTSADNYAGVVAAEAEAIRDRHADVRVARLVRHVVQVALRVGRLVVDRRRHLAVANGQRREDRLDRARSAEAVTGCALR